MADHTPHDPGIVRSFRDQRLTSADFSSADLRGADFSRSVLHSATFRDARLGVRPVVGAVIVGLGAIFGIIAGIAIGWALNGTTERLGSQAWDERAEGGTLVLTLTILIVLIAWRGLAVALKAVLIAYPLLVLVNVVANWLWEDVEYIRVAQATVLVLFLVLSVAAGIFARVVGGVFGAWAIALVAVMGGLASGHADSGLAGVAVAVCLVLIARRTVRGDPRDAVFRRRAQQLVRRWGTSFVDADLTGSDFTGTDASRCDVRGATLVDVRWDPEHMQPVDAPWTGMRPTGGERRLR